VEVNPSLDKNNKTAKLAVELIGSLLGEQIL
jgi:arginase